MRPLPQPARCRRDVTFSAALAVVALGVVAFAPAGAQAQTAPASDARALRAEADEIAGRYLTALGAFKTLEDEIAANQAALADAEARAARARTAARKRALAAYKTSGRALGVMVGSDSTLNAARRAHLIDRVNAVDNAAYDTLRRTSRKLQERRRDLADTRDTQRAALEQLKAQGAEIDAKLAAAAVIEQQRLAAVAPTTAPPAVAAPTGSASTATTTAVSGTTIAPTAPPTTKPPAAPPAPPGYVGTPGTNPHHDDPFLTCVRARESGGNYGAINPAGPYLGAYQFLQSTWNATANHAGRTDLIGVPANVATPYDQDEMAWVLYQWAGMGPWGGHCP